MRKKFSGIFRLSVLGLALLLGGLVYWHLFTPVQDSSLYPVYDPLTAAPPPPKSAMAPDVRRNVFFGDLHIHTRLSSDAFTQGVRGMPEDAYTFARGGTTRHPLGYAMSLSRPLDFAAVTDHAEYLGMLDPGRPDLPLNRRSPRDVLLNRGRLAITSMYIRTGLATERISRRKKGLAGADPARMRMAWQRIQEAAERHNEPGVFTTFTAYEWTSFIDEEDANLHRNVVYRSARVPERPFSSLDSNNPEDLWRALQAQEARGMEAIAIPHNSNLSNGRMWMKEDFAGRPLSAEYAGMRMRYEPISEILQIKGASETHPALSGEDEFAGFEIYEQLLSSAGNMGRNKGSYMRDALRMGLELAHRQGFNPWLFGVIGSSDGHNASSPVEESGYHGKFPTMDGSAALRTKYALALPDSQHISLQWGSGGLAAVWAEENTRDSLFAAMRRKETYATSGTRIMLRFFGGWRYSEELWQRPDAALAGYAQGVPMGGRLPPPVAAQPVFAVSAWKDPDGANLDRIQIIKGWVDAEGQSREKIYNVAASDGRVVDPQTGALPPVGNTVDLATARYRNSIGAVRLTAVWSDPDFDPAQQAFYYARALEIPTPRWSTFDAVRLGIAPPEPSTLQERAISSAIWYRP